jgi:hypothetical protein
MEIGAFEFQFRGKAVRMVDLASSRDTLRSWGIAVGSGGTSDESCSVGHAVRWRRGSGMGPHPSFLSRRRPRRLGYPFDDHVRDRAELREHGRVGAGTRHGSCQRNDRRPGTKSETVPRPNGLAQRRRRGAVPSWASAGRRKDVSWRAVGLGIARDEPAVRPAQSIAFDNHGRRCRHWRGDTAASQARPLCRAMS